jgi:hypothetical protein
MELRRLASSQPADLRCYRRFRDQQLILLRQCVAKPSLMTEILVSAQQNGIEDRIIVIQSDKKDVIEVLPVGLVQKPKSEAELALAPDNLHAQSHILVHQDRVA